MKGKFISIIFVFTLGMLIFMFYKSYNPIVMICDNKIEISKKYMDYIEKNDRIDSISIFLSVDKLQDIPLFGSKSYMYLDSNGTLQSTKNRQDVPPSTNFTVDYYLVYDKSGKIVTVPSGGGSVGIMHKFFHVKFEGKNQKNINKYDNKIRGILGIPERSLNDPKHENNK